MPKIIIIAAMDQNSLIGRGNGLPWPRIKADMQHFRQTTVGHPILMGRKTFESIGSKPLPMRSNLILTRDRDFSHPNCEIVNNHEQVLGRADEKIFVIGGTSVYQQFLPHAHELYLTQIGASFEGDTYFPDVNWQQWLLKSEKLLPTSEENRWPLRFTVWERL